jgi:hypothetical protein
MAELGKADPSTRDSDDAWEASACKAVIRRREVKGSGNMGKSLLHLQELLEANTHKRAS